MMFITNSLFFSDDFLIIRQLGKIVYYASRAGNEIFQAKFEDLATMASEANSEDAFKTHFCRKRL